MLGFTSALPSMSSTQDPKLAPQANKVNDFSPSTGNSRQGSRRNSQQFDIKNFVEEQITKCTKAQASSLEDLAQQINTRVQAYQNMLDMEMARLRKENEWFKTVPAGGRRNSSFIGNKRTSAESQGQPQQLGSLVAQRAPSVQLQTAGSLEVLDLEMHDSALNKDAVKSFNGGSNLSAVVPLSDGNDVGQPPAPLSNNLLTTVVPLPEDEAPKTAVDVVTLEKQDAMIAVRPSVTSPLDQTVISEIDSSDDDGRHNFEVSPVWRKQERGKFGRGITKITGIDKSVTNEWRHSVADFGEVENDAVQTHNPFEDFGKFHESEAAGSIQGLTAFVIHPNGFFRGVWDLSSLVLVFYDLVFIPLMLLDLPESAFGAFVAWTTRIFWSVDLCLSPITGYLLPDGSVEMRPRKIFKRYFKSWLFVDLMIVLVDWMEIFWAAGGGLGFARIGKASRVFRILRLLRLLRLIRMLDIMREFLERIHSERLVILANIFKIMVVICGMAHLMACIWYKIGNQEDEQRTWVAEYLLNSDTLEYKYMTSLHWACSQFSGGMDEVRPRNFAERVYAILCFLIAFMMAGVFISSITSSMTQLHLLSSRKSQQVTVLRRFLAQHGISHRLAIRVQRNATHAIDQQQRYMPESNVELLELVSTPLRSRVHFEMYAPTFSVHPFFAKYVENCPHVMRRVCHSATSISLTSCCDVIFNAGEIAAKPAMYIVCTGILNYVSLSGKKYTLGEDAVLAEAVLWTTWMHQGTLTAETNSHLLLLDAHGFQFIVTQFEHIDFNPKDYAEQFVTALNDGERELSDLPQHLQDNDEIAVDMISEFSHANKSKRKGDRIFGMRRAKSAGFSSS